MNWALALIFGLFSTICFADEILISDVYTVQVYSSLSLEESKNFSHKFHSISPPFIGPVEVNNQMWFRVYLGTYHSFSAANEIKKKIQEEFQVKDAFVIQIIHSGK